MRANILVLIWCLFWCFGVYMRWNAVKGKSAANPYAVGVCGVLWNFSNLYKLELITRRLQVQILSPQPCENPCGIRLQGFFFFFSSCPHEGVLVFIWCLLLQFLVFTATKRPLPFTGLRSFFFIRAFLLAPVTECLRLLRRLFHRQTW